MGKLLTKGMSNAKTAKGSELGITNMILHLAPGKLSGNNACPMASAGCLAACLNTAGRGQFDSTQHARIEKTKKFYADPNAFVNQLAIEIAALQRKAQRLGTLPAVRLNGTSDIRWELFSVEYNGETYPNLMTAFPIVQFYDYTKLPNRRNLPNNYHVTFSLSETNDKHAIMALASGMNVAVVFDKVPDQWSGYEVIDGDAHDFRFLDKKNVIVGLKAKGKAKHDTSGFVRSCDSTLDASRTLKTVWQLKEVA